MLSQIFDAFVFRFARLENGTRGNCCSRVPSQIANGPPINHRRNLVLINAHLTTVYLPCLQLTPVPVATLYSQHGLLTHSHTIQVTPTPYSSNARHRLHFTNLVGRMQTAAARRNNSPSFSSCLHVPSPVGERGLMPKLG